MNKQKDLTRWNRAGLHRFRYIDGNGATYLELLRCAFADRFPAPDWKDVSAGGTIPETDPHRLVRQYNEQRGEWAWEIARVLARSCHVLAEYIDAYANEGYLDTASQWDNLRRLVEMLDYHPAPPASASTSLVLEAKKNAAGLVKAGFQVQYAPEDGGSPVIFETLEDINIDHRVNRLRPVEYDRNQHHLGGNSLFLEGKVKDLKIGEPVVLEDEQTGALQGHLIQGIKVNEKSTRIRVSPRLSQNLITGYVWVHIKPEERLDPLGPAAKGAEVKRVLRIREEPDGLLPGMVVWISDGKNAYFRRLIHVHGHRLVFDAEIGILQIEHARIGLPVALNISKIVERPIGANEVGANEDTISVLQAAGDWSRLTGQKIADQWLDSDKEKHLPVYTVTAARYHPVDSDDPYSGYTLLDISCSNSEPACPLENPQSLLVPPATPGLWTVDTYLEKVNSHLPATIITGKPKKTSAKDLAVVVSGRQMSWTRLASVAVDPAKDTAELSASGSWQDRGGGDFFLSETTVYSHFKEVMRLDGWRENNRVLRGNRIPLANVPDCLGKGRSLLVERIDDPGASFLTRITGIQQNTLYIAQKLAPGFTYGNCVIAANIVRAGHGEARGEKVLGSGDAIRSNQSFVFEQDNVSFVPDSSQPSGVRATIDVRVAGRTWKQTGSLKNSGPADPHYIVRMTEEGFLRIVFGDGTHGRRLPTGSNNVRITWREGSGLTGNLPTGSLTKPVKKNRFVGAVRQPLAATGGNDMEGIESLRQNAPATVLILERAVSLADFSSLAMSQSSVWQARAFSRPTGLGRNEKIEVVVVPAGGGNLGSLEATLRDFLQDRAIPGVEINIVPYKSKAFSLEVHLAVSNGYDPENTVSRVKATLEGSFSLQKRKLGQALFLSEVYEVVESTTGVEHSRIIINGNESLRRVVAEDHQVLTLGKILIDYEDSGSRQAGRGENYIR